MSDIDYALEKPVAITCPDCGGALRTEQHGTFVHAHCHIGHRFSAEALFFAQFSELEHAFASALRRLAERIELCRYMAGTLQAEDPTAARQWEAALRDSESQVDKVRGLLTHEWVQPESARVGPTDPSPR